MNENGVRIGAKLLAAFGAMLVLVVVPLAAYVGACQFARRQLGDVLHRYNRKLDIAIGEEMSVHAETLRTIARQLHAIVG